MGRKAPINRNVCGPRKGDLLSAARGRLPDAAFGLPALRKYPLYVLYRGQAVPDHGHAVAAKGRATQQFERGTITRAQLREIHRRADRVLAMCSPGHGDKPPRPPAKRAKKRLTVKLYCDDGHVHRFPVDDGDMASARRLAKRVHAEHHSPCAVGIVNERGIILEQWEDGDGPSPPRKGGARR